MSWKETRDTLKQAMDAIEACSLPSSKKKEALEEMAQITADLDTKAHQENDRKWQLRDEHWQRAEKNYLSLLSEKETPPESPQ